MRIKVSLHPALLRSCDTIVNMITFLFSASYVVCTHSSSLFSLTFLHSLIYLLASSVHFVSLLFTSHHSI